MDGIFRDDAERDRVIVEIAQNTKLILDRYDELRKYLEKLENRLRCVEDTQAQHKVYISFLAVGIAALVTGFVSKLVR
jgi:hypothetical protein